jgi:hypothetical protein
MRSFVNREPAEESVVLLLNRGMAGEKQAEDSSRNNLRYKVDLLRRRVIVGERVFLNYSSSSAATKETQIKGSSSTG